MPANQAGGSAVEVDDLRVSFGSRLAVDGISFAASAGEVLAILGPNGAGKTTTVETIEGYRSPDSGKVRVLGADPVADRAAVVPRLGVVLQRGGIYPMMSPSRALALFASYYKAARDPAELIEALGLQEVAKTPYKRLSGGEQQRLALGLAIVGRPDVACLDEPTAGVDPAGRAAVREIIAGLRDDGVCVVLTSHELDEVERLADRVVIIDHGKVVAAGALSEIGGSEGEIRFESDRGLDTASLSQALSAEVTETKPGHYLAPTPPSPEVIAILAAWLGERGLALGRIEAGKEKLESIFLRLIKSDQGSR
ncbi:MAG: ABC transporter ATP-binding protein [Acidimicrobiales bacterium]